MNSLNLKGYIIFDIDGVIRDVTYSYRLAIQKTVLFFTNWEPLIEDIDLLKGEGIWNNDWDLSYELISRYKIQNNCDFDVPNKKKLIEKFNSFYFGERFNKNKSSLEGFIKNEELLINKDFFSKLTKKNFKWGFFSGAERLSANHILVERLNLKNPPLIAMGEAFEKPNPQGFINLIEKISNCSINSINLPLIYVGDTVADVHTIRNARNIYPTKKFFSFAVAPPHLHVKNKLAFRAFYENTLLKEGADFILKDTSEVIDKISRI